MTVKICVHETVPDEKIGFSVIMAKYEGKWIFVQAASKYKR